MADVHSKAVRSYNMSKIRSKNTRPEIVVRKYLFAQGFRYRLHAKELPGKPDILMPKYKTAIFVHGCFWHGHEKCKYYVVPKTKTDFWLNKINGNILNDIKAISLLKEAGWNVIVIWECDLKKDKVEDTLSKVSQLIKKISKSKHDTHN